MSGLPTGWAETSLGELIELKYGKALPDRERSGNGFPVFGSNGVVGYHNTALTAGATVVIGRKGSVGEVNFCEISCSPIDTTYYVDSFPGSQSKYWYYKLRSLPLKELNKSTAIPGVSRSDVYPLEITVAPLPEQKRIADKLDSVLARVDACRDRLDRLPALLKRFRQSILTAATSGKLTEDWRLATDHEGGSAYPKVKLSTIATSRLGKMLDKAKNSGSLTPYLRNVNVRWFAFDLNDVQEMRIEDNEREALLVKTGDLLICEGGEPGRCAIWHGENGQFIFQKALHRVRPNPSRLSSLWLAYSLKFAADNSTLENLFTGTTIKHLTGVALANFEIPLPPLPEQTEIVRRVEILFAFADRLEARLATARKQVGQLTPALLAKAFRGELVAQDPADEPAAELLKRLADQREAAPRLKRGRAKA